jgi:A/G-specific adenine glycosylase
VYKVLVSEVMLQQTQVDRVIPFYKNFIRKFPTAQKLAAAPLSEVLKHWQGLGYNRRAKLLREAAKELATKKISTVQELEALPGVGPYTARAVTAFAFNQDGMVIETNIRTAVIHHFFASRSADTSSPRCAPAARPIQHLGKNVSALRVTDAEIADVLDRVLPKGRAREWYSALMDYGAHLKRTGISHNTKSKTYTKQSAFRGSLREARGAIVRELAKGGATDTRLAGLLGRERRAQVLEALGALREEGLITKKGRNYILAD